jgi:hypothetical protein
MTIIRGWKNRMCAPVTCLLLLASTACTDSEPVTMASGLTSSPSPIVRAGIRPQTVLLSPIRTAQCSLFPAFTTAFDLFIDFPTARNLALHQVSFRLLDGSHVGSSPITFSAQTIATEGRRSFFSSGSTGLFTFRPQFGCEVTAPRSLAGEIVLVDGAGFRHVTNVTAAVR